MNEIKDITIFQNNSSTLKETSKDTPDMNGSINYMTESMLTVINFDNVKLEYTKNLSVPETPKSNDALYIINDSEMYFIEFKSGFVDRFNVRLKIFDSLLIITDIIKKGICFTRKNLNYILVYNIDRNKLTEKEKAEITQLQTSQSMNRFIKTMEKRSGESIIRFTLKRFKTLYFKDVFTVDKNEFEKKFLNNWEN